MSTQPRHNSPGGDVRFITPKPEGSGDKKARPREEVTRIDTGRTRSEPKRKETRAPEVRPIPTMGWPAFWWKITKALNPNATPPQLSKHEVAILEEAAQLALQQAEEGEKVRIRAESIQRLREYSDRVPSLTVAFIGVKGASGTTTTTAHTCSVHGDITRSMVVATDFNPAQGTLSSRLGKDYNQTTTIRELLADVGGFDNFRGFIRKIRPTRYSVRPISANDIVGGNEHMNGDDAKRILDTIEVNTEYHYIDTANDITDEVTLASVARADVLVFTAYVGIHDSLRQLAVGMETLRKHGYSEKVDRSLVVISGLEGHHTLDDYRKYTNRVNIRDEVVIEYHFRGPFLGIPYDPVIRRDTEVDLEALRWETYQAYLELDLCIFEQSPTLQDPLSSDGTTSGTQHHNDS